MDCSPGDVYSNEQSNSSENGLSNSCDSYLSNVCSKKHLNISDNRLSNNHDQNELGNACDSIHGDNSVNRDNTSDTRLSAFQNVNGTTGNNKKIVSGNKKFGKACHEFLWKAKHDRPCNKRLDRETNDIKLKQLSETTQIELKKLSETFEGKWGNVSDSMLDKAGNTCNDLESNKNGNLCDNQQGNNCENLFVATHVDGSLNEVGHNGFGNTRDTLNNNLACNTTHSGFNKTCHKLSLNQDADLLRNACQYGAVDRCDNIKPVKNVNVEPGDILDVLQSDNINDFNLDLLKDMSQYKSSHLMGGHNTYLSSGTLGSSHENVGLENHVTQEEGSTHKGAGFPFGDYYTPVSSYHTQPVFPSNIGAVGPPGTTFNDKTAGQGRIQGSADCLN